MLCVVKSLNRNCQRSNLGVILQLCPRRGSAACINPVVVADRKIPPPAPESLVIKDTDRTCSTAGPCFWQLVLLLTSQACTKLFHIPHSAFTPQKKALQFQSTMNYWFYSHNSPPASSSRPFIHKSEILKRKDLFWWQGGQSGPTCDFTFPPKYLWCRDHNNHDASSTSVRESCMTLKFCPVTTSEF